MISGITQVFFGFPEWKSVGHLRSLHSSLALCKGEEAEEGALPSPAAAQLTNAQERPASNTHTCNTTKRHVGETLWQLMCSWGRLICINYV